VRRVVEPEWLDTLPPDDPSAQQSRRDLQLINRQLGNRRWFQHQLAARWRPGEAVLELGAGDGELARALAPRFGAVAALDRVPAPPGWPAEAAWHQADVLHFDEWARYPVVLANLFLHHFSEPALAGLGAQLNRHARLLLFSETLRSRRVQWLFAASCWLNRAHPVTRHDGHVSIAAGFRGHELPGLLRLDPDRWTWRISSTRIGAYRVVAERRA